MEKHLKLTPDQRLKNSQKLKEKYPRRLPVIVTTEKGIPKLDKDKFLVPKDLLLSEFCYVVRQRMTIDSKKALLLLSNNKLLRPFDTMEEIFEKEKDKDCEFLYITACGENTFGTLAYKGKR